LLCLALIAGSGSGCFWPQDDQLLSEIPPQKNRPPRIRPSPSKPDVDSSFLPSFMGSPCPLPFQFNVEDPDLADNIRTRWFVYQPGAGRGVAFQGQTVLGSTTPIRGTTVTAPITLNGPGSELIQNGEHRVEVVIADGEFAGSTTELLPRSPRILPDGGTIEDQSYIDTYLWIVKTSDTLTACQ
jgi:hypothetical protein